MKICRRCNQEIDTKKEKYTHVEDWNCENIEGDSWWHLKCFLESMNKDSTDLQKNVKSIIERAGSIISNLQNQLPKKEEEYILK